MNHKQNNLEFNYLLSTIYIVKTDKEPTESAQWNQITFLRKNYTTLSNRIRRIWVCGQGIRNARAK